MLQGIYDWTMRKAASDKAPSALAVVSFVESSFFPIPPDVMLVPMMPNVAMVLTIFSLAFFGQQSWSTLVMVLPTDLVPRRALGKFAGLVGLGGAMGGVVLGQAAGWMLDHGFSYTPVLTIAASLHLIAFALICLGVPRLRQLSFTR